jgi:hypothetical protein
MQNSNFKVYIGISIALVVLLMLILVIPFSKKTSSNQQSTTNNLITPTSVEVINPSVSAVPAQFTGVSEEELPQATIDAANQKQNLRNLLPLLLSSFSIDFNYEQDKFIVTLSEPKDQSRTEFDQWKNNTYPAIDINQFNFQ